MKRLYKKFRVSKDSGHYILYKSAKKDYRDFLYEKQIDFETQLINKKDSSKFFKHISKSMSDKPDVVALMDNNSNLVFENTDKIRLLNDYFSSNFTKSNKIKYNISNIQDSLNITEKLILNAIKNCNKRSAAGPDGIPMIFWVNTSTALSKYLSILFTKFVKDLYIPELWKTANVVPLYK
jgi:hypothetical protein